MGRRRYAVAREQSWLSTQAVVRADAALALVWQKPVKARRGDPLSWVLGSIFGINKMAIHSDLKLMHPPLLFLVFYRCRVPRVGSA